MRTILSIALVLCTYSAIQAQDTIYRSNGTLQVVEILELKENAIRYISIPSSDGTVHNLSTSAISKIVFTDGFVKPFFQASTATTKKENKVDPRATDFGRNLIAFNGMNVPLDQLTVSYERTARTGKWSLRIPVSVSLARQDSNVSYNPNDNRTKTFSTGIELNFYPYGQGTTKFFYGPAIEFGKRSFLFQSFGNGHFADHSAKTTYYALLLQCGFLFQPTKHLNFSLSLGIGVTKSNLLAKYPAFYSSFSRNRLMIGRTEVNIGYKL